MGLESDLVRTFGLNNRKNHEDHPSQGLFEEGRVMKVIRNFSKRSVAKAILGPRWNSSSIQMKAIQVCVTGGFPDGGVPVPIEQVRCASTSMI